MTADVERIDFCEYVRLHFCYFIIIIITMFAVGIFGWEIFVHFMRRRLTRHLSNEYTHTHSPTAKFVYLLAVALVLFAWLWSVQLL